MLAGEEGGSGGSGAASWPWVDGWLEVAGSVWAVAVGSVEVRDGVESGSGEKSRSTVGA